MNQGAFTTDDLLALVEEEKRAQILRQYLDPSQVPGVMDGIPKYGLGPMTERTKAGLPNEFMTPRDPSAGELAGGGAFGAALDYGPLLAQGYANQADTAGQAIGEAADDPSLRNMGLAAGHTALAMPIPSTRLLAAGLGGFGAALGDAAVEDSGVLQSSAQAADGTPGLNVDIPLPGKMTPQDRARALTGVDPEAERQHSLELERIRALAAAEGQAKAAEATERLRQAGETTRQGEKLKAEEDEAKRGIAVSMRDNELAKARSFSDTNVGQVYDKMGGFAPLALGATFGGLARAARGPGKSVMDNYVVPWAVGTSGVLTGQNAPDLYDLSTPKKNPEKSAYEIYARELPGDDPARAEALAYANSVDDTNPVYQGAYERLSDPGLLARRAGLAAVEGLGGLVGHDAVQAGVRAGKAISRVPGNAAEGLGGLGRRYREGVRGSDAPATPVDVTPVPPQLPPGAQGGPAGKGAQPTPAQVADGSVDGSQKLLPASGAPSAPQGANTTKTQQAPSGRYVQADRDFVRGVLSDMVARGVKINSIAAGMIEKMVNVGRKNKIPKGRIKDLADNTKAYLKSLNKEVTTEDIKKIPTKWKGKDLLSVGAIAGGGAIGMDQALDDLSKGKLPGSGGATSQKREFPKTDSSYSGAVRELLGRLGGS